MYKPAHDIYITPHPRHPERLYLARQAWHVPLHIYQAYKMLGPRDHESRGRVFHKSQLVLRLKALHEQGILVKVIHGTPELRREQRHNDEMAEIQERQAHKPILRPARDEDEEMDILDLYKAVGGSTAYSPEARSSPTKVGILRLLMAYEVCQCLSPAQWQEARKKAKRLKPK